MKFSGYRVSLCVKLNPIYAMKPAKNTGIVPLIDEVDMFLLPARRQPLSVFAQRISIISLLSLPIARGLSFCKT